MPWRLTIFLLLTPLWGDEGLPSKEETAERRTVDGEMLVKWEDTYYFDTESQPFTGRALSKFQDGTARYDATIVDGKPHGTVTIFHRNGNKMFSASYEKGIQQGIEYNWHPNGVLQFSIHYERGKRHGKMTSWRADGSRQMDIFFVHGKIHGPFIVYDESEKITTHRIYHDGKLAFTRKSSDFESTPTPSGTSAGLHKEILEKEKYQPSQDNNPGFPKKTIEEETVALYFTPPDKTKVASLIWVNDTISPPFKLSFEYLAIPYRTFGKSFGSAGLSVIFNATNQSANTPNTSGDTSIIPDTGGYALQLITNGRVKYLHLHSPTGKTLKKSNFNPSTDSNWKELTIHAEKESIRVLINGEQVLEYSDPEYDQDGDLIAISAANGKYSAEHAIRNLQIETAASPKKTTVEENPQEENNFNEHKTDVRTIGFTHLVKKEDQLYYELGQNKPFTGITLDYYKSGQLKLETHYEKGRMHGVHSIWYPDGKISVQTIYSEGNPSVKIKWDGEGKSLP